MAESMLQTSSAFCMRNLSGWEVYLCRPISRISLQSSSLTPLILYILIKKMLCLF